MKFSHVLAKAALIAAFAVLPLATHAATVNPGDLLKMPNDGNPATDSDTALYYLGANNKRFVFPNEKTYRTWYNGFSNVKTVDAATMASYPLGGNVTYRPGIKMVKIDTDPKTYAVTRGGVLRWIKTEAAARALYGTDWNKMVEDVPDAFFINYKTGAPIETAADFSLALMRDSTPNINSDKQFSNPTGLVVDVRDGGNAPASITVSNGQKLTWVNLRTGLVRVASNPHPAHTALPGFESGDLVLGQEYTYTFTQSGNWGYHNHWDPSQIGTVQVQ